MAHPDEAPPTTATGTAFAGWGARVGAWILDNLPQTILFVLLTAAFGDSSTGDGGFSFQLSGFPFVVYLVGTLAWFGYNWLHLQGSTGQTLGKKALGISVLGAESGRPIGAGLTFARQLAHIVDGIPLLLGYLWPIWDAEKRTFADMIMSTRVRQV